MINKHTCNSHFNFVILKLRRLYKIAFYLPLLVNVALPNLDKLTTINTLRMCLNRVIRYIYGLHAFFKNLKNMHIIYDYILIPSRFHHAEITKYFGTEISYKSKLQ